MTDKRLMVVLRWFAVGLLSLCFLDFAACVCRDILECLGGK